MSETTNKDLPRLRELLQSFKDITLSLINDIESGKVDELEALLNKRENYIEEMNKLSYEKEEFKKLCLELDILLLQQKMTILINKKRSEIKNELDILHQTKNANSNYKKGFKVDSLYFNKKI
jgi:hypothetical protein